ncbi:DUF2946 family protein [Phaeovulum sp.]|uniref:DUF2946 family protein n=1 Tax=Phaeovulum sp. TaxID=2934796 RepID=UPI0035684CA3
MRGFALLLTVCAVLFRALLPDGLMLSQSRDGAVEVVICTEGGYQQILVGRDGQRVDDTTPQGKTPHATCPYSLAGNVVLPVAAAVPFLSTHLAALLAGPQAAHQLPAWPIDDDNAPRGPPLML